MDNVITGVLSATLFIAFVAGLAESIGALPFIIIVGIVSVMMLTDLVQSFKAQVREKNKRRNE